MMSAQVNTLTNSTSNAFGRRMVSTITGARPTDCLRGGDPVAHHFGKLTGLRVSSALSYLKGPHPERVALLLTAFRVAGSAQRYECFAAPFRAELEGIDAEPLSHDLILEKAASDGLEDTYRDEWLCWRDVETRRRWLRALAKERADNLRLHLALERHP